ncbi:protein ARV1 [Hypanus sabinus]|uniref:protein ARV1 n=1 Tax=Hypanus sabinus TaxID=79690 RepID=UPI0028C500CB|nr:protein ARV1 [Hypanus sabinus]
MLRGAMPAVCQLALARTGNLAAAVGASPPLDAMVAPYRCVECNEEAMELHRDYSHGIIKITICRSCQKPVDKYVEYDPVIILIDAILCKVQAYRHIILNSNINIHWKLCIFCLLCEAYLRWSQLQDSQQTVDPIDIIRYAKEWDFYLMFGLASLELTAFLSGVFFFLCLTKHDFIQKKSNLYMLLIAILLSGYGKLLVIPVIIWEHDDSPLYINLINFFVLASNAQAVRVVLNSSRRFALSVITVGWMAERFTAYIFQHLEWST